MSADVRPDITAIPSEGDGNGTPPARPRLKKLRLLAILIPLGLLAMVSTVFGMMMAVASDLPDLENRQEYKNARNSVMYDVRGKRLGVLTSNQNRVLVNYSDIAPVMRFAVISIEDRRFFENSGVDLRGIGRAFFQDVVKQRAAQGGSTITQQFVKNALRAQSERTLFQKLRESALAYHLTRKWSKKKILTQYLNSVYFGNGAYGIESAARTYFGQDPNHLGCGQTPSRPCAKELAPHEAALLAAIIASPSAYDPVAHPAAALARRNLVLDKMGDQERLTAAEGAQYKAEALPASTAVSPPREQSKAPYFTTWVRQQLVDRYGARRAFEGGLKVTTTLDLEMQAAAQRAVDSYLAAPGGPTAAMVVVDNQTGEVRAMVGGRDYQQAPFNLATQGQRQPGSAIKPFILATALTNGIGPGSVWPSRKREFTVPHTNGREKFVVNNFNDNYSGVSTLARGLTYSDNSVFAAVGISLGTKKVARMAERMGIRTPVSTNYAMTLGGLQQGVTPLDMAHAYETIADGGLRVTGSLGAGEDGPVGVRRVEGLHGTHENDRRRIRVLNKGVAAQSKQIMSTVVSQGPGHAAAIPGMFTAGKTGTTENAGDAWFVGFNDRYTAAVWVGYPDKLKPMTTEFRGQEVTGGTFPALIWRQFMLSARGIIDRRVAAERARINAERVKKGLAPLTETTPTTETVAPAVPAPVTTTPPAATTPAAPKAKTP